MKGSEFETQRWTWQGLNFGTQPHEAPCNLQVGHVECVLLTISYHLYFLCISNVFSTYITGHWGKFTVKNATLCFYIYFLDIFCCFPSKECVLIIFISFFDAVSNFQNRFLPNSMGINQLAQIQLMGSAGLWNRHSN